MHPNIPGLVRLPVFITILVFAVIVLGLDANLVNKFSGSYSYDLFGVQYNVSYSAPTFAKLGVATSVITIASIVSMLVIDILRRGAPTSFIAVELGWLALLWVLWLATAADTASWGTCSVTSGPAGSYCSQFQAAEAFSFLSWILIKAYWVLLLAFTLFAAVHRRQSNIWFTSVSDADFTAEGAPAAGGAYGGQDAPVYSPGQPQMSGAGTGATYPLPDV